MAADAVGYSKLMGRDESGTLARLREHRKDRFEPALSRYGGRLVKLTGDGALAEFPSAVDALSAAIEFQQAMAEASHQQPEDTRIVFRIGLHLGDLIVDGDDLYGDGVNVAARLEAEAPPGGIVISGNVHDAVFGRLKAIFSDLGKLTLKNIERPISAFRVGWEPADWKVSAAVAGAAQAEASSQSPVTLTLPDKPSIAVLPFQNMSGDPEQEFFADGMTEDIITSLSRFKSLFVIARNSSFTYKGKSPDIRQVGRELGVRYVLEGSVRKAGGRLRITGQLIDTETGAHLWADRFESSLEDVFELQDQVTTSVVGAIAPKIDQAEMERVKRKPVENLDAYDSFLRGMANTYKQTRESWEEALRLFYHAIELDPDFSTPYGMAARCYVRRKTQGWVLDKHLDEVEVRRLASQVSLIGRDDALALCWAGQALVAVCKEYDGGGQLLEEAFAVNPNLAVCWQLRGYYSLYLGHHEAALGQIAHAMRLSPMDPEAYRSEAIIATALLFQGKYDEAQRWAAKATAHQPNWVQALRVVAAANALAGNIENARKAMGQVRELDPALRLSNHKEVFAYRRPEDMEKIVEGLRLAGLPE